MWRLKTENIRINENWISLNIKFDVYVNQEGLFTTTLSEENVKKLEEAQVRISSNRLWRKGYFENKVYEDLVSELKKLFKWIAAREKIKEEIFIEYDIQTLCSYMKDENGEIVPNWYWAKRPDGSYNWLTWTKDLHAWNRDNFGITIYVALKRVLTFKYLNWKEVKEEEFHNFDTDKLWYYWRWLEGVCWMWKKDKNKTYSIEYTEDKAKIFVDIIKWICWINERLKEFITPDKLEELAKLQQNNSLFLNPWK